MGCYPLRVIVSKALGKCNGRERWMEDQRMDYAMAYPPGAPTQTHYMQPVARTVTFSATNSVHIIPPQQQQQQHPDPQPQPQASPPQQQHEPDHQPQPEQPAPAPTPEQGAPPADHQPKRKKKSSRRVRFGPEPPPPQQQQQDQQQQHHEQQQQQQQQPEQAANNNPGSGPPGHRGQQGHGPPPWYVRYMPSPLPRWEATPRRHEYFSGEYRYSYPTPVREGIYSMATDANRLTTIFSEENPNACAIV